MPQVNSVSWSSIAIIISFMMITMMLSISSINYLKISKVKKINIMFFYLV